MSVFHKTSPAWVLLLGLFTSCASNQPPDFPRFEGQLPVALAIRIQDLRPPIEKGKASSPEWIHTSFPAEQQAIQFAAGVGNALVQFRAIPTFAVMPLSTQPGDVPYLLHLDLLHWYGRWPTRVDREARTIAIEGRCDIEWILYRKGRKVRSGHISRIPPHFEVPLSLIRKDNVDTIMDQALVSQGDKAQHRVLDELMRKLSRDWPP
jgi:hypothetical protein